ncbi:MAG TPA: SBBP repeat-containing protein [Terriglobales bacterium]|nr:SBBP repeat-containing protein [Terriglobales bacterium]
MRFFAKTAIVSWCVLIASLLGTPTANAGDGNASAAGALSGRIQPSSASTVSADRYLNLPLSFEANQGQADGEVRFLSRGDGHSFFLTPSEAVLTFSRDSNGNAAVLKMRLEGANPNAQIHGVDPLPGRSNYFVGSDSSRWRTDVPTYAKVAYHNLYPGIDLVYYGNQKQLEYDFVVSPAADAGQIRLSIAGAQKLTVDEHGNLVLHSADGEVQLLAPRVYQEVGGTKQPIAGRWKLEGSHAAGFRLGRYNHNQQLVIDPVLMYSSFLGGSQKNAINRIAIDAAGNAYVAGYTVSGDFPAAPTPQTMTFGGGAASRGAFVAKIDPTGSTLLYSTYLSGSGGGEAATGLAVDASGNVYLAGNTNSTDFPTYNPFQSACATHTQAGACSTAFLTKISPTGDSLVFSTYLGGSGGESASGLTVDAAGSVYVTGITSSLDFPVTTGAAQSKCGGACQQSAFVAKFAPSGQSLSYATYLGGSGLDTAADIAVDGAGGAYIAGQTTSSDFPLVTPFQKSCAPDPASTSGACIATAFVTKLKADGSTIVYSTFLAGSLGSQAAAIAVDSLGSAYVTGSTQSSDFPVVQPFQKSCGMAKSSSQCSVDAFVTKLAPSGKTLVYSTYLGGSGSDQASAIVVDSAGHATVAGTTESADFPTVAAVQSKLKGTNDAFVARLNAAGSALTFSTYHGGSATESGNSVAIDAKGNIYVAGATSSTDFPTQHPFQSSCTGTCASAFVSAMSAPPPQGTDPSTTVVTPSVNPSVYGQTVTFTATVTGSSGTPTGTVEFMDGTTLLDTGTLDASGVTTFPTSALTVGAHSITGVYSGDATYAGSTSGAFTQNVNQASTTTTVTASPATSSPVGQPATFTATVAAVAPGAGIPVGTVGFDASGTPITGCSSVAVNPSTGVASCMTSALAAGSYTIKGAYTPTGGNYIGSNGTLTYAVVGPPTITKAFSPTTVKLNVASSTSTMTLTITNPAANTVALTGVAVSDTLPSGMALASPSNAATTCAGGTVTAASGIVSLSGGSILASSSCTLTANVVGTTAGNILNTTGAVTSTNGGTGFTASATLTVVGPPTITKAFSPTSVQLNVSSSTSTMTLTITNPSAITALTGVAVSDTLPSGMGLAASNGLATNCASGTATAAAGVVSLTGATIPASSSCTVTVSVVGTTAGAIANTTGTVSSTNGGTGGTATGTLIVVAPPVLAEAFNPSSIPLNSTSSLNFTVTNPAANTVAETGVAFADTLPSGLTVTTGTTTQCGGTLTTTAPATIAFAGGTVAAGGSCTISATVTGATAGNYSNLVNGSNGTTLISSSNGGTGVAAAQAATLTVVAPPTLAKAFNPATITLGATSALNFTINNPVANSVALTGVAFTDTLPAGVTVATGSTSPICGGTLATTAPSTISLSGATIAANSDCLFPVTVTGAVGGVYSNTVSGAGTITSSNGGTGVASNTATITVQDYQFAAVENTPVLIQGSTTAAAATVTVTPEFTYAGTVSSAGCTPTGVFTCSFSSLASGSAAVTITNGASTPVGVYSDVVLGSTDNSTPPIMHTAVPLAVAVECTYSVGNTAISGTIPTYTPELPNVTGVVGNFSLFVTETAGGNACPWTGVQGTSNISVVSGSTGQLTAPNTGGAVTFSVNAISSSATVPQVDQVTVNYFQVGANDQNNLGSSVLNVVSEVPVDGSVSAVANGVEQGTVNLTVSQTGTLTIPNIGGTSSVCNVIGPSGPTITCAAAQNSQGTWQVTVTVSGLSAAASKRSKHGGLILAYALGFPAIVFLGAGISAFGPRKSRRVFRRIASWLGILLAISLLVALPGCGGGFKATFLGQTTTTTTYSLTIMGYSTDANGNVLGVEIFTIPLTNVQ